MILSDIEKHWLLRKLDEDKRFGRRGNSMIGGADRKLFDDMASKNLVETKDVAVMEYRGFSLTDTGEKEAMSVFNNSDADELERLGRIGCPVQSTNFPLPKGIFTAKKDAQKKVNQKKN